MTIFQPGTSFTVCVLALYLLAACCTAVDNTGWICEVEGTRYKDGDIFTTKHNGPCVTYQCKGGSVHILKTACNRNGKCMDINQTWTEHCLTYKCESNSDVLGVKVIKGGCMIAGTCIGVDDVFQQGCFNYTCQQRNHRLGPTFRVLLKEWGCSFGGKCVPANYTLTQSCVTRRCEERNGSVGMYDLFQGVYEACITPDNKCVKVGESHLDKCRTYKCTQQEFLGIKVFNMDPVSALCQDADGKCHGDGEFFSMRFNADIMNCTCTVSGISPHYKCGQR